MSAIDLSIDLFYANNLIFISVENSAKKFIEKSCATISDWSAEILLPSFIFASILYHSIHSKSVGDSKTMMLAILQFS